MWKTFRQMAPEAEIPHILPSQSGKNGSFPCFPTFMLNIYTGFSTSFSGTLPGLHLQPVY